MSEEQKIKEILKRYLQGECTDAEREALDKWYGSFDNDAHAPLPHTELRSDLRQVGNRLGVNRASRLRRLAVYGATAAVVALAVGLVVRLAIAPRTEPPHAPALVLDAKDILPAGDRATLTLSDGRVITLDERGPDAMSAEFETYVVGHVGGSIQYRPLEQTGMAMSEAKRHTLRTPKGRQFTLTLPDGSVVMLNAMSSLTYDVSRFSGERTVHLAGEAYFDVVAGANRPFRVVSDGQTVTVLGTKFNVNCYPGEPGIRTTLIEGVVDVVTPEQSQAVRLAPGEQAFVVGSTNPVVTKTGTANPLAWTKGLFHFNGNAIDEVMRELGRWYDVDIEFKGAKPATKLWGEVNRNTTADIPLRLLAFFDFNHEVTQVAGKTQITIYSH